MEQGNSSFSKVHIDFHGKIFENYPLDMYKVSF